MGMKKLEMEEVYKRVILSEKKWKLKKRTNWQIQSFIKDLKRLEKLKLVVTSEKSFTFYRPKKKLG